MLGLSQTRFTTTRLSSTCCRRLPGFHTFPLYQARGCAVGGRNGGGEQRCVVDVDGVRQARESGAGLVAVDNLSERSGACAEATRG